MQTKPSYDAFGEHAMHGDYPRAGLKVAVGTNEGLPYEKVPMNLRPLSLTLNFTGMTIFDTLGDCRKMTYEIAPDFRSSSRRENRRIVERWNDGTVVATQGTDEKTSRMVCHLIEIALRSLVEKGFLWSTLSPQGDF